jgi:hypothetical protein|uniref:Uncharacterized protein n=1 Tax=viral metagenome TaxID=1070528 RepID=A0A6C0IW23_9ZZZZ
MEDIIWNRLNKLGSSDVDFIHYYKLDTKIAYNDIETIYEDYISKHYFNTKSEGTIFSGNEADKISIRLSLSEPTFANVIENIFEDSVVNIDDSLVLFYIKGEDHALLLFKSFYPLSDFTEVKLPHFCYYLTNKETISMLNKNFKEGEELCLMHCST